MRFEGVRLPGALANLCPDEPGLEVFVVHLDTRSASAQLCGDLDMNGADLLERVLAKFRESGRTVICLDLSRLTFLDCAGLAVIVQAHDDSTDAGGALILTGVIPRVERLFALTRVRTGLFVVDRPHAEFRPTVGDKADARS